MGNFIEFCTSQWMIYILSFGWAVHAFYLMAQNRKLLQRCNTLQNENVKQNNESSNLKVCIEQLESQLDDLTKEES